MLHGQECTNACPTLMRLSNRAFKCTLIVKRSGSKRKSSIPRERACKRRANGVHAIGAPRSSVHSQSGTAIVGAHGSASSAQRAPLPPDGLSSGKHCACPCICRTCVHHMRHASCA
eukprot:6177254-Pleurochrysis_carterae.AAC.2